MSAYTSGVLLAAIVFAIAAAIFESFRLARSACQLFIALWASSCPAGGSPAEPRPSKDGAAVDRPEVASLHGPHAALFLRIGALSSRPRRRFSRPPIFQPPASSNRLQGVVALPLLAAIDPSPNFSAFGAGVELGIFTALFTISSLLVVNWIVKTMRSSK